MSASQFASFAAYTPPPDEDVRSVTTATPKTNSRLGNVWFPGENSYQSGGIPSFGSHYTNDTPLSNAQDTPASQWETRYGWRVDILAAAAYILGPVSALVILILETQNDYVRYHAYQSALLTTPAVLFRVFLSLFQSFSWLTGAFTFIIVVLQFFLAFLAYRSASGNTFTPYRAPFIGRIAEDWVAGE